ncbi:biotin carboxylase N-terminal domain-containing protein [Streptomyces djakartensis]|uniref:biotin carboxylase N-terminal domain-containing protein n=1 Tax=Streptomyces djakartensis TaxID=68193 RepID=UPI00167D996A
MSINDSLVPHSIVAVRVIRAARELDLPIVALRSRDEADALHARMADEVWCSTNANCCTGPAPGATGTSRRPATGPPP